MARTVQQLFDLSGRNAIVTGGACGLGLQTARALGEAGARLMLCGPDADVLEAAMAELQAAGLDARWCAADVHREAERQRLVQQTLHRMGPVDILVQHAAPGWAMPDAGAAPEVGEAAVAALLHSFQGLGQRAAAQSMIARRQGRIVLVAPPALAGESAGLQAAVVSLAQAMAASWRSHGITVNAICPRGLPAQGEEGEALKGLTVLLASAAGRQISGQGIAVACGPEPA